MKEVVNDLAVLMGFCISLGLAQKDPSIDPMGVTPIELLIVDEAERLNVTALEWLRDLYDRAPMGLILTGMPGIEKSLSRYAQLYSRVGFAHEYQPLKGEELTFVLRRHWKKLGLALDADDFTDDRAIAAVARITGGNYVPQGWHDDDWEQKLVRRHLIGVLSGRVPLTVRPEVAQIENSPYPPPPNQGGGA